MIRTYHHGRFEFFIAVTVIAIVAIAALGRYSLMAKDARILRMEIISHHFMAGAANTRAQFLIENVVNKKNREERLMMAGQAFYFSSQGWPASISGPVTNNYQTSDEDCYQLWALLLQNPAPITKGITAKSDQEYRVFSRANSCRYEFTDRTAYFDYYPLNGRLVFIPTKP